MRLLKYFALGALALPLWGCGPGATNQDGGTIVGAVAGGVIGNQFGSGAGRALATVGGAVIGGIIGNEIGRSMDEADRQMEEQYFKFDNHPRETVNWYQALAFCRWLSWRLGGGYDLKKIDEWKVRLPTEFEWEKAARGTDRIYPYEGDYDPAKANTVDTGIRQTSAVGIFPNGVSPDGAMDMSGNVWEWCLSDSHKPAHEAQKENLRNEHIRVLRGGSWLNGRGLASAACRRNDNPDDRNNNVGFRLCCAVRRI